MGTARLQGGDATMTRRSNFGPPFWLFVLLMVGGFMASGVYVRVMSAQGPSAGDLIRAVGFAILGLLMLWGVLAGRTKGNEAG